MRVLYRQPRCAHKAVNGQVPCCTQGPQSMWTFEGWEREPCVPGHEKKMQNRGCVRGALCRIAGDSFSRDGRWRRVSLRVARSGHRQVTGHGTGCGPGRRARRSGRRARAPLSSRPLRAVSATAYGHSALAALGRASRGCVSHHACDAMPSWPALPLKKGESKVTHPNLKLQNLEYGDARTYLKYLKP